MIDARGVRKSCDTGSKQSRAHGVDVGECLGLGGLTAELRPFDSNGKLVGERSQYSLVVASQRTAIQLEPVTSVGRHRVADRNGADRLIDGRTRSRCRIRS